MINRVFRIFWRCLIFLLGFFSLWATVTYFIPFVDSRIPLFFALLATYSLLAYVVIPALIRLFRLVIKPNHIPRYATTGDGWAADPVNIAVVARNQKHFVRTMRQAGWYTADKATLKNNIREAYALIFNQPYLTAPFSNLYLFGRGFDIGFQIPYGARQSPRHRHHVRFWHLQPASIDKDTHAHSIYWLQRLRTFFAKKQTVWIGAAINDTHITGLRWRNLQITHANSAKHIDERDLIIASLEKIGAIKSIKEIKDGEPFKLRGQNIGTTFVVDGYINVITLK